MSKYSGLNNIRCKVTDCETNQLKDPNPTLTFHKMPCDSYFQKIWFQKCGLDEGDALLKDNFYVCSIHFTEEDFCLNYYNKKKLKSFAVPNKNLPKNLSEPNIFLASLEAVDGYDAPAEKQEIPQKPDEQKTNSTENDQKNLLKKYRHLQLDFEILQDRVKEQETVLLALKKENSKLNDLLATRF